MTEDELQKKANDLRCKNFTAILNKIEDLPPEKRLLWQEIYENAITDRQHGYALYSMLVGICGGSTSEHAVHGRTIIGAIEKMAKANDQIIKLAELIRKAEEKENLIDPDIIYNAISAQK